LDKKVIEFVAFDKYGAAVGEPIRVRFLLKTLNSFKKETEKSKVRVHKRIWIFDDERVQNCPSRERLGFEDGLEVFVALKIRAGTVSGLMNRDVDSSSPSESSASSSATKRKKPKAKKGCWQPRLAYDDDDKPIDVTGAVYFPAKDEMAVLLCKGPKKSCRVEETRMMKACQIEVWARNNVEFGAGKVARIEMQVVEESFVRRKQGADKSIPREMTRKQCGKPYVFNVMGTMVMNRERSARFSSPSSSTSSASWNFSSVTTPPLPMDTSRSPPMHIGPMSFPVSAASLLMEPLPPPIFPCMMGMPQLTMPSFESSFGLGGFSPSDMPVLTSLPMTPPLRMFADTEPPQTAHTVAYGLSPAHSTGLNAFGYAESGVSSLFSTRHRPEYRRPSLSHHFDELSHNASKQCFILVYWSYNSTSTEADTPS
jgi:hypothetical protein